MIHPKIKKKLLLFLRENSFFKAFLVLFNKISKDNIVKLWSGTTTPLSKSEYQLKSRLTLQVKNFFTIMFIIFLFTNISKAADLRITEVFPYGKNERIEIYNNDIKDFSGDVELSGVKAKMLDLKNIYIPAKKCIIIWDNWNIRINDVEILDKKWLSISDDSAIDIKLFIDGVVVDNFQITKQDVVSTDKKNSFEKIFRGDDVIVKSVNTYSSNNILPWIQANPGIVHILGQGSHSNILQVPSVFSTDKENKKDKNTQIKDKEKTTSSLSTKSNALQEENKSLKQKLQQTENELNLTKVCLNLFSSSLKSDRNSIYYQNWFEKIDNFYKIELLKIKDNSLSGTKLGQNHFNTLFKSYQTDNIESLFSSIFDNILEFYFIQTYNDFINLLK